MMKILAVLAAIGASYMIGFGTKWIVGAGVFAAFIAFDLLIGSYTEKYSKVVVTATKIEE